MGIIKYDEELIQKIIARYLELADIDLTAEEFSMSRSSLKRILRLTGTKLSKEARSKKKSEDMRKFHESMSDEKRQAWSNRQSQISQDLWVDMPEDKKVDIINARKNGYKDWRETMTETEKREHSEKLRQGALKHYSSIKDDD